jgi:predicted  nucleic acid-binding Zn-ribbon protein
MERMIEKMTLEKLAQTVQESISDLIKKVDQLAAGQFRLETGFGELKESQSRLVEGFSGLKEDHRNLEENFVGLKDYMDYRFIIMEGKMEKRFERVSMEFDVVHEEIKGIHHVLDRENDRTTALEKRVDVLENHPKLSESPA